LLRDIFGYDEFRGHQAAVIEQVSQGGDALVVMPTGSGKSLCFQIPSLIRAGAGVVVSPLIALMEDQVAALREAGVRAAMLNSSLTGPQQNAVLRSLRSGELDLLYIAPERLLTEPVLTLLAEISPALFAIDEAHCVSRWGHDFRPEYLGLSVLHERFPSVPRVALTATADERTRREIVEQLNLHSAAIFVAGFDRPNIRYQIVVKDNVKRQLGSFLGQEHPFDSGIVYCLTRAKTEEIADWLTESGRTALPYHAGLSQDERRENQARFLREDGIIMVATIAFGMGIDKPDVRFVAHVDLPRSIEAYYQETGRAGRDGLPANAWMAYGLADAVMHGRFIDQSDADDAFKKMERGKLSALIGLCETTACRRQVLLEYFGDCLPEPCGNCDSCLFPAESWDATIAARKILFLIRATDQRFGAQYLIDVLHGRDNERIKRFGHDALTGYGRGKELTDKEWRSVIRQLVALGYLTVDLEGWGALRLTPESRSVLEKQTEVRMRKEAPKSRKETTRRAKAASADVASEDQSLYDALVAKRLVIARERAVPPYVIFDNKTLREIASIRPSSLSAFREIHGVGDHKLEAYGATFLEVIKGA
jgi:ATP-dependent DNA helicase RecQ